MGRAGRGPACTRLWAWEHLDSLTLFSSPQRPPVHLPQLHPSLNNSLAPLGKPSQAAFLWRGPQSYPCNCQLQLSCPDVSIKKSVDRYFLSPGFSAHELYGGAQSPRPVTQTSRVILRKNCLCIFIGFFLATDLSF